MSMYQVFIDGASRVKDGHTESACAAIIYQDKEEMMRYARGLGNRTNNQAEYEALILALSMSAAASIIRPIIYSDSQLVVNQVNGKWKVKHLDLLPFYMSVMEVREAFPFDLVLVKRTKVFYPDALCNTFLDKLEQAKLQMNSPT